MTRNQQLTAYETKRGMGMTLADLTTEAEALAQTPEFKRSMTDSEVAERSAKLAAAEARKVAARNRAAEKRAAYLKLALGR